MTRRLALCADDYGLSMPISTGIGRLVDAGRLTDVSCIVNAPAWRLVARRLDPSRVRMGLHLNLTEGRPLSSALAAIWPTLPDLRQLLVMSHLNRLPLDEIRDEWRGQLDLFEHTLGRPPAHLDGHQHVHHLPHLRHLLLELLERRTGLKARHTGRVLGPGFAVKRLLIEGTGGKVLGRALESSHRARNLFLLGVYDFRPGGYRGLMQGWLKRLPDQGALIFCHPGEAPGGPGDGPDPIAAARVQELAYLGSAAFADDLAAADVQLDRLHGQASVGAESPPRRHAAAASAPAAATAAAGGDAVNPRTSRRGSRRKSARR